MSSTNNNEKMAVWNMIADLSNQIDDKFSIEENLSQSSVQSCLKSITNNMTTGHAMLFFDEIVPFLFIPSSDMNIVSDTSINLPNSRALLVLATLVTFNATKFLKFASRSIFNCVLSIPKEKSIVQPSAQLITIITMQLVGNDVEVTSNASKIIVFLCHHSPTVFPQLFIPNITNIWNQAKQNEKEMKQSLKRVSTEINQLSTICVRCATVITEVCILSNEGIDAFVSSGASSLFLNMLQDSSDPLVQISAMDLLQKMAQIHSISGSTLVSSMSAFSLNDEHNNHNTETIEFSSQRNRCKWLFSAPVLNFLLRAAGASHDDEESVVEADPFLGGQALKIVSTLCPLTQHNIDISFSIGSNAILIQQFQRALYNFDYAQNEISQINFIDAISSFAASSTNALDTILDDEILMERWLSLSVSKPKLKAIILLSVARILDPSSFVPNSQPQELQQRIVDPPSSASQSCVRMYQRIGQVNKGVTADDLGATTSFVHSLARSPMPEVRIASYMLWKGLVKSGKILGVRLLLNEAGHFEFLISRDLEITKEGREAKYGIIEEMMKIEGIRSMLEDRVVLEFDKFLKQGPHYVQTRRWDHDLM